MKSVSKAKRGFREAVEGKQSPRSKKASYIGELSSGYDATTPDIDKDQNTWGKAHQEAVHGGDKTDGGAHFDDKRDEVLKAATHAQTLAKAAKNQVQSAKNLRVVAATLSRAAEKLSSYIGELSSGYDATTPDIDKDQNTWGKAHQEAVHGGDKTDGGAHFDDKRDEVQKAADSQGMRMLAQALETLEKEARMDKLSDDQQSTLAESFKSLGKQFDSVLDKPNALEGEYKNDAEILVSSDKQAGCRSVPAPDRGVRPQDRHARALARRHNRPPGYGCRGMVRSRTGQFRRPPQGDHAAGRRWRSRDHMIACGHSRMKFRCQQWLVRSQ